jgi:hypothetical protein
VFDTPANKSLGDSYSSLGSDAIRRLTNGKSSCDYSILSLKNVMLGLISLFGMPGGSLCSASFWISAVSTNALSEVLGVKVFECVVRSFPPTNLIVRCDHSFP